MTKVIFKRRVHTRTAVWRCVCVAVLVVGGCGGDAGEVQPPEPMPDPSPIEYPVALWDSRVQGETELMIHVNELGDVDSVMVSRSSGQAEFDSAAVQGGRRLRFTPGRRGERHIAMWTRIPIRFAQDSTTMGTATESGVSGTDGGGTDVSGTGGSGTGGSGTGASGNDQ